MSVGKSVPIRTRQAYLYDGFPPFEKLQFNSGAGSHPTVSNVNLNTVEKPPKQLAKAAIDDGRFISLYLKEYYCGRKSTRKFRGIDQSHRQPLQTYR
jgi:hypothetical protein